MIIFDKIECFLMEEWIKNIYYNETQGICKECREKRIWCDPMEQLRCFMGVRLQLMVAEDKFQKKGDTKMLKDCQDAIVRLKKREAELEAIPEVQAEYRKNNPASYKGKAPQGTKCAYCGENEGQLWINNPNGDWTVDTCRWICKPCEKIIELQERQSMHCFIKHKFDEMDVDTSKIDKSIEALDKEIDAVAYEDGQVAALFEIYKKLNDNKYW